MKCRSLFALLFAIVAGAMPGCGASSKTQAHKALAAPKDAVFDLQAIAAPPLNAKVLKTSEAGGIVTEEVQFHSETDGAKSVDIFAFLVYPKGATPGSLPAFIWNQGGLYQADTGIITTYGAKRGYVAMCIDFPIQGYRSTGGYPINSNLETAPDPHQAPIYHGAVALLRAVSYLQSRPEVDKDRIGMCGSSWGGFYTTLMVGVDPRLKVGSAMFGCGYLQLGNGWWGMPGSPGSPGFKTAAYADHWAKTLDPGSRLHERQTPIAWTTGTDDMFYYMPALMASYQAAAGPKHLGLIANYAHALDVTGDEEVFSFMDIYLKKDKQPYLSVTPLKAQKEGGKLIAKWEFSGSRKAASASVMLSYGDAGNWTSRYWKTLPARIEGGKCMAELPAGPMPYYISGTVVDTEKFFTSTPLVKVDPAAMGLTSAGAKMDYDGCSEWGGFEPDQVTYQQRHGFMNPKVSHDAKEGKQSAELAAGENRLYPIYFTVGVPHRFTCYLKAEKPGEVTVRVAGSFDAKAAGSKPKTVVVGTGWTECTIEFTPPQAQKAELSAFVTVPKDAKVLVDAVSFRPME